MFSQAAIETEEKKEIEAIEEQLQTNSFAIETKIAGLRAQLVREFAKTKAKKSGQALTENYISHWLSGTDCSFQLR